jgi:hypothetical protein
MRKNVVARFSVDLLGTPQGCPLYRIPRGAN